MKALFEEVGLVVGWTLVCVGLVMWELVVGLLIVLAVPVLLAIWVYDKIKKRISIRAQNQGSRLHYL